MSANDKKSSNSGNRWQPDSAKFDVLLPAFGGERRPELIGVGGLVSLNGALVGGLVRRVAQLHFLRQWTLAQGNEFVFLRVEGSGGAASLRLGTRRPRLGVCLLNYLVHGYSFLAAPGSRRYALVLGYSWPGLGGIVSAKAIVGVSRLHALSWSRARLQCEINLTPLPTCQDFPYNVKSGAWQRRWEGPGCRVVSVSASSSSSACGLARSGRPSRRPARPANRTRSGCAKSCCGRPGEPPGVRERREPTISGRTVGAGGTGEGPGACSLRCEVPPLKDG